MFGIANSKTRKALTACLIMVVAVLPFGMAAQVQRPDTLRTPALASRDAEIRPKMLTSVLPVSIKQQGRQLCVQSRYNQLLPIYTEGGIFYTAFRITKGTNWLTGLPRGTYQINNRKYTIN